MSKITKIGLPSGGTTGQVLKKKTGTNYDVEWGTGGGGSGTVTNVSVVSANGFAGTVATSTTTPAITLSTTVTGILKGNGTSITAASAGTDYQAPLTNPVTGTGTTGQVAYFNGTSSITGESNLFWDATNDALSIGNNIKISTLSAFGLNYILFNALTSNQGISASFSPSGTPTGYAYNFQFSKSSSNTHSLLFIGGGSSGGGGSANKHLITTSADSGTGQPLVFRAAPTNTNWFSVNDHFTIFPTGNVVIQSASSSATDSGFKLDVNGTTRTQGDFTISDTKNIILGTTTGTKIGTATTQKIGFFNATPVVQPSAVTTAQGIADALSSLGLLASSSITTTPDVGGKLYLFNSY